MIDFGCDAILGDFCGARIFLSVDDTLLQFNEVVFIDVLGEGKFFCHEFWQSHLVSVETGIRRYD